MNYLNYLLKVYEISFSFVLLSTFNIKKIFDFFSIFFALAPGFFMNIINRKKRTDNENINKESRLEVNKMNEKATNIKQDINYTALIVWIITILLFIVEIPARQKLFDISVDLITNIHKEYSKDSFLIQFVLPCPCIF